MIQSRNRSHAISILLVLMQIVGFGVFGCDDPNNADAGDHGPIDGDTTIDGDSVEDGDTDPDGNENDDSLTTDCAGPLPVGETPPSPAADCDNLDAIIYQGVKQQIAAGQEAAAAVREQLLDPGTITVVLCGTGSPFPTPRAESCTAVFVGGKFLLFDAGNGAVQSMLNENLPLADLDALFLTHFHSDHMAEVGNVVSTSWILGRQGPLPVYGGEGLSRIVGGFNRLYALDETYRRAHHGEGVFPPGTEGASEHLIAPPDVTGSIVYDKDGIVVKAYPLDHSPVEPAFGYRIEYQGRVVAISGDSLLVDGLRNLAQGADILVGDAMNKAAVEAMECAFKDLGDERNESVIRDIRTYHLDISELAQLAEEANVKTLALTHMVPGADNEMLMGMLFEDPVTAIFSGELLIANDGDRVSLSLD